MKWKRGGKRRNEAEKKRSGWRLNEKRGNGRKREKRKKKEIEKVNKFKRAK